MLISLLALTSRAALPTSSQDDVNRRVDALLKDMTTWADQTSQVNTLPEKMLCNNRTFVDLNTLTPAYMENLGRDSWKQTGRYQLNTRGTKVFANFFDGDQYYGLLFKSQDLKNLRARRLQIVSAYEISGFNHGDDFFKLEAVSCTLPR